MRMRLRDTRAFFQTRYNQALGERLRIDRRVDVLARVPSAINETVLTLAITTSVLYMVIADKDLGALRRCSVSSVSLACGPTAHFRA